MILLAKEINIGKEYVLVYLSNGDEIKQQGTLHGYTDTTFAVNREGYTYVYDINNKVITQVLRRYGMRRVEAVVSGGVRVRNYIRNISGAISPRMSA